MNLLLELVEVGIDLFGLIRLKHCKFRLFLCMKLYQVGIDLFGLIRLKPKSFTLLGICGICRD